MKEILNTSVQESIKKVEVWLEKTNLSQHDLTFYLEDVYDQVVINRYEYEEIIEELEKCRN